MSSQTSLEKGTAPVQNTKEHFVEDKKLEKEASLQDTYHLNNDLAFKGDDSDGKIDWTARSIIAAMTLGALYTGTFLNKISKHPLTKPKDLRSCFILLEAA